jgi:hypothetical protein
MDDDVKPKISFNNTPWRFNFQDPEFGWKNPGGDDVNVKRPGEKFWRERSGADDNFYRESERGLNRPPLNGLSKRRTRPTKKELALWAQQERKLIEEALRGDRRCGYKKKLGLLENEAARLLVERYVYTIQCRAWKPWRKVHPARNFNKEVQSTAIDKADFDRTDQTVGSKDEARFSERITLFGNDLMPSQRRSNAIEIDDVIAAALERFWRAVRNFGPNANNGLFAYAEKWIDGAISDTMHDWHNSAGYTSGSRRKALSSSPPSPATPMASRFGPRSAPRPI